MAKYINDNGEFWDGGSIVINGRRYISPSDEILEMAGYHIVMPEEPTEEELLEIAKADKISEIRSYDNSENVNLFYLSDTPMWLDAKTRQTLRISVESYQSIGSETVTKWFNGQQFTFPTNVWLQMLNALEVYAAEALNVTEQHKSNVNALTDIEAVESYDYTKGYPQKLNLNAEWMRSLSQQ